MGLAASQARLLSITSRLADNELRAQITNNAKMRLATESSRASTDYVNALNDATMMITNYDEAGNEQYGKLNFNRLTEYSPYNTQYGLANSYGQLLVNENEAAIFESVSSEKEFLKAHGLEFTTSYFDDDVIRNSTEFPFKITGEKGEVFAEVDLEELRAMYFGLDGHLGYEVNKVEYNDLYNKLGRIPEIVAELKQNNAITVLLGEHITHHKVADNDNTSLSDVYEAIKRAGSCTKEQFNTFLGYVGYVEEKMTGGTSFYDSLMDLYCVEGWKNMASSSERLKPMEMDLVKIALGDNVEVRQFPDGHRAYFVPGDYEIVGDLVENLFFTSSTGEKTALPMRVINNIDSSGNVYMKTDTGEVVYIGDANIYFSESDIYLKLLQNMWNSTKTNDEDDNESIGLINNIRNRVDLSSWINANFDEDSELKAKLDNYADDLQVMRLRRLEAMTNCNYTESGQKLLEEYFSLVNSLKDTFELNDVNMTNLSFTNMSTFVKSIVNNKDGNQHIQNIYDAFVLETFFDVYGEPLETWYDHNNPTGDAETKAQWYMNLYQRMLQGYTVLEDGLAASNDWIEFALESGLVNVEQVDKFNKWNGTLYSNVATITEVTDDVAVARAEAEYKRAMNEIESKDKRLDIELKNIDTEHNALQTEYESIKNVIGKNIERSFKMYNA